MINQKKIKIKLYLLVLLLIQIMILQNIFSDSFVTDHIINPFLSPQSSIESNGFSNKNNFLDLDSKDIIHDFKNVVITAAMCSGRFNSLRNNIPELSKYLEKEAEIKEFLNESSFINEYVNLCDQMVELSRQYLNDEITFNQMRVIFNEKNSEIKEFTGQIIKLSNKYIGSEERSYSIKNEKFYYFLKLLYMSSVQTVELIEEINHGLKTRSMQRIQFVAYIKKLIRELKQEFHAKNIENAIMISPDSFFNDAFTNKSILRRALREFTTNAVKYSGSEKINLEFLIKNSQIHVVIKDYGKGLSQEELENSFMPGVTSGDIQSSTGWGLPSIENSISAVGGRIGVISKKRGGESAWYGDRTIVKDKTLENGTSITFTLPIISIKPEKLETPLKNKMAVVLSGKAGSGRRVAARVLAGFSELGLKYYNPGFLIRALTYELIQKNINLDNENSPLFLKALGECADSIDIISQPVRIKEMETAEPDSAEKRQDIWNLIDHNEANTHLMHKIAAYKSVQKVIHEKHKALVDEILHSDQYNGLVIRVTEISEFSGVLSQGITPYYFELTAPSEIREFRTGKDVKKIDRMTNREKQKTFKGNKITEIDTLEKEGFKSKTVWNISMEILSSIYLKTKDPILKEQIKKIFIWSNFNPPDFHSSGLAGFLTSFCEISA